MTKSNEDFPTTKFIDLAVHFGSLTNQDIKDDKNQ